MSTGRDLTASLLVALCFRLTLIGGASGSTADLYKIVTCINPKFDPSVIGMFYGCYCGPGGQGTPVDDIDKCCKVHDDCYQTFEIQRSCQWYWPVLTTVSFVCNVNSTEPIKCRDENLCRKTQCNCDAAFSQCLHKLNATTPATRPKCPDWSRNNKFDLSWLLH
ncbi:putative Acidic phospholipase A2 3 [Hypsibius exemplaris]|uniref:Phospholipase A2 n=1 Tax=Hypsibius exemplaris TaxID=2072580 RepID=A0A1W0X150_HYPEX|nr:putative Acidic phospholipase A2 3 [Hypsibius exemplaris]